MRNGSRTKKLQENRIIDGRGQGTGEDYRPFMLLRNLFRFT
jgi:hypothetical protein